MISHHSTAISCSNRATTFQSSQPNFVVVVVVVVAVVVVVVVVVVAVVVVVVVAAAVAVAPIVLLTGDEERPRYAIWKAPVVVGDGDCYDGDGDDAATDDEA